MQDFDSKQLLGQRDGMLDGNIDFNPDALTALHEAMGRQTKRAELRKEVISTDKKCK